MSVERADALAIEALERISRSEPADRVIKRVLRAHPELDNTERSALARRVHGVRCFERRLCWMLERAGAEVTPASRVAAYRVAIEGHAPAAASSDPVLRTALERIQRGNFTWPPDPIEALATHGSMPTFVTAEWVRRYGLTAAKALIDACNVPGPVVIRANGLRTHAEALRALLAAEKISVVPDGFVPGALRIEGRADIRGSLCWRRGLFEVQDGGSQLVAAALEARPGETVIDLCAGAGGKTLAIAGAMENRGQLFAADPDPQRLADLEVRLRRSGVSIVRSILLPAGELPETADRVLVDAPCSALGTLRRGPDRRWAVTPDSVEIFASKQLEILRSGARRVKRGGRLVYATCTLLEAENQRVVAELLRLEPELVPAPVLPGLLPDQVPGQVELLPHVHGTDGFFVAAFSRR